MDIAAGNLQNTTLLKVSILSYFSQRVFHIRSLLLHFLGLVICNCEFRVLVASPNIKIALTLWKIVEPSSQNQLRSLSFITLAYWILSCDHEKIACLWLQILDLIKKIFSLTKFSKCFDVRCCALGVHLILILKIQLCWNSLLRYIDMITKYRAVVWLRLIPFDNNHVRVQIAASYLIDGIRLIFEVLELCAF